MLLKKYITICFIPLLFPFLDVTAQEDTILYSPEQLQNDARFYFGRLKWQHPDIYYYCDQETFERKEQNILQQLNRPMTKEEFIMVLGTLNSCLDDHSGVGAEVFIQPYLGRWVRNVQNSGNVIFPRVYVHGNKLYADIGGKREELLSVNGIEVQKMLTFIKQHIGHSPVRLTDYLVEGCFSVWAYTCFDIRPPFEVTFKNKRIRKAMLQGITLDEFEQFSWIFSPGITSNMTVGHFSPKARRAAAFRYDIYPSSSIAILSVNTFNSYTLDESGFDNMLKHFSDSIARCGIRHLFIDVSKNTGGTQQKMFQLFDILHHDTVYYESASTIRDFREDRLVSRPWHREVFREPNRDGFKGKLYVLQGTASCSSSDLFCRIVAQCKLGGRIGQSTGTLTTGFTSVDWSTLTMNTRIRITVASEFYDFTHDWNTESLPPDMLWDVDYTGIFTEKELKNIIEHWNKQI